MIDALRRRGRSEIEQHRLEHRGVAALDELRRRDLAILDGEHARRNLRLEVRGDLGDADGRTAFVDLAARSGIRSATAITVRIDDMCTGSAKVVTKALPCLSSTASTSWSA